MHKFHLLLLVLLFLGLNGCEEKEKTPEHPIPIENCTVEVNASSAKQDKTSVFEARKTSPEKGLNTSVCLDPSETSSFTLSDEQNLSYQIQLFQKSIEIKEEKRPITLLSFFATWCPPCVANIPSFNSLEQTYNDKIFIASVRVHDTINAEAYEKFLNAHSMRYFVSTSPDNDHFVSLLTKTLNLPKNFNMPLTVLYVHGKYFTHYEGAVPLEMLEYDIQQAIKTLD